MTARDRAIAPRRALARAGDRSAPPPDGVAAAEARLAAVLAEVTALDLEVEALSADLDAFARAYERTMAAPFADLDLAERLVRRIQALEDEVARAAERVRAGASAPRPRREGRAARRVAAAASRGGEGAGGAADAAAGGGRGAPAGDADPAPDPAPEVEADEIVVKRLHRRLARVLHPDLAGDDAERGRLGELMAKVNAAYARRDRTALELMAERLGAGEPLGDLSPEERVAHLARRAETLARIAASLRRERDRLAATRTARLRDEARRREAEGRDYLAEALAEVEEDASAAYADALSRLGRLGRAARDLGRARKVAMSKIVKRGPTGARRAFDPLGESDLVRRGAAHLERRRATPAARDLARRLEDQASAAPWEAALALLAFFAEAGGTPPESVAEPEALAERWDAIRAAWPGAPELARALARLPRHLEVGVRAGGGAGELVAGMQLADPDLLAGVRIALEREAVAVLARTVLAALGPSERCDACAEDVRALHLLRTRGLDELNGHVCPRCGAVLRSYWRYGEAEGLEALAPFALELGLVAEQVVTLGGTAIGFQMLPAERDALTADRLRRRFAELYLATYEVALPPERLRVASADGPLAPGARVARVRRASIVIDGAGDGPGGEELLELLRARIERRFRP